MTKEVLRRFVDEGDGFKVRKVRREDVEKSVESSLDVLVLATLVATKKKFDESKVKRDASGKFASKEDSHDVPEDISFDGKFVEELGGSTGAELWESPTDGKKYVVKQGKTKGHIEEEFAANEVYRAAGVAVPGSKLIDGAQVAKFIEGDPISKHLKDEKVLKQAREGFAMDALMANWDVVGLEADNMIVDKKGKVWRIDNGGSLRYRAQGKAKGEAFGSTVPELETMRDPNKPAGRVFSGMTDQEVADNILATMSTVKQRQAIRDAAPKQTLMKLDARMNYMRDWAEKVKSGSAKSEPSKKAKKKVEKGASYSPTGHKVMDYFGSNIGKYISYTKKQTGKKFEGTIVSVGPTKNNSKSSALVVLEKNGVKNSFVMGTTAVAALSGGKLTKQANKTKAKIDKILKTKKPYSPPSTLEMIEGKSLHIADEETFDKYTGDREKRAKKLFKEKYEHESLDEWADQKFGPPPPVSKKGVSALKSYTGSWASKVNSALWGESFTMLDSKDVKKIGALDSLIETHGVEKEVWRSVPYGHKKKTLAKYRTALENGKDVVERGYVSCSGKAFNPHSAGVYYRVKAKKALNAAERTGYPGEQEYLVGRESRMRVLKIDEHPNGGAIIYMEQVI